MMLGERGRADCSPPLLQAPAGHWNQHRCTALPQIMTNVVPDNDYTLLQINGYRSQIMTNVVPDNAWLQVPDTGNAYRFQIMATCSR